MRFEFAAPSKIIFGEGTISEAARLVQGLGTYALLVAGGGESTTTRIQTELEKARIPFTLLRIAGEPTIETVAEGVRTARTCSADVVIGCGGGSAIDTAKAVASLSANEGEVLDYLEVVGKGKEIERQGLAVIAMPTTAGTGSEVTRNAVLAAPEQKMKVSLRSPYLIPRVALVDPELSYSLPPSITASTGMDALTQVLEPFVSLRANPMADLYCRAGMERIGRSLLTAFQDGDNRAARQDMSWGSLMGGLALANAGLGAVHGFASPIGGMFDAAHGMICARLLAPCVEVNLRALRSRSPENPALIRFGEASRLILGSAKASQQDLAAWLSQTCQSLKIPSLSVMGITQGDFMAIVEKAKTASSMKANPIVLQTEELFEILERSL